MMTKRVYCILLICVLAFLSVTIVASSAQNIVKNAGFEEKGDQNFPKDIVQGHGRLVTWDGNVAYSGKYSVKVAGEVPANPAFSTGRLPFSVDSEDMYFFAAAYVKADIPSKGNEHWHAGRLFVKTYDLFGWTPPRGTIETGDFYYGTFGWKRMHRVVVLPKDTEHVALIGGISHTDGVVWFDDLLLVPLPVDKILPIELSSPTNVSMWEPEGEFLFSYKGDGSSDMLDLVVIDDKGVKYTVYGNYVSSASKCTLEDKEWRKAVVPFVHLRDSNGTALDITKVNIDVIQFLKGGSLLASPDDYVADVGVRAKGL